MPITEALSLHYCPVAAVGREFQLPIPYEVTSYAEDFEIARREGGLFDLSLWRSLEISGPDAKDFLQRMSTVDFRTANPQKVENGALLTGKGTVIGLGYFLQMGETFHYLVPPSVGDLVFEHLQKFHFSEKLTLSDKTDDWAFFGAWGSPSTKSPGLWQSFTSGGAELIGWRDDARPELVWIRVARKAAEAWFETQLRDGTHLLGHRLFEYFRRLAGVPEAGKELREKEIILEGNFDRAVARNKGCYPGQEVVERIFTYGQVNKKLLKVRLSSLTLPGGEVCPVTRDGAVVGQLAGWDFTPQNSQQGLGLAYIHKSFWDSHDELALGEAQGLLTIARD